jgi:hypothetical protein
MSAHYPDKAPAAVAVLLAHDSFDYVVRIVVACGPRPVRAGGSADAAATTAADLLLASLVCNSVFI